jgi:hypothetical protein
MLFGSSARRNDDLPPDALILLSVSTLTMVSRRPGMRVYPCMQLQESDHFEDADIYVLYISYSRSDVSKTLLPGQLSTRRLLVIVRF